MSFIVVYCTVPDVKSAKKLSHKILEAKLAACISIQKSVTSLFVWEGKLEEESESLLFIKTKKRLFDELEKFIIKNHPYDIPEIIALPIIKGHTPYLRWIKKQTKGQKCS